MAETGFLNPELYEVVLGLYQNIVAEFSSEAGQYGAEEFLGKFPYSFLKIEDDRSGGEIVKAARSNEHAKQLDAAIGAYYSDSAGGDNDFYLCDAVEDFLNYIVPRTIGLPNAIERFNKAYRELDRAFFGKTFLITVFAVLSNFWNQTNSRFELPLGFAVRQYMRPWVPARSADTDFARDRIVPYLELKKAAHPIAYGRELPVGKDDVLEYSKFLPINRDAVHQAYVLRDEIARKFVFSLRLLDMSAPFSDYRGFRMPGHLSAHSMNCMNLPDEYVPDGNATIFDDGDSIRLSMLFPVVLGKPYNEISLMDRKIEDAIRRPRRALVNERMAKQKSEIDEFLDYFQMLESVVPSGGSEYIALYATVLLKAVGFDAENFNAYETFRFLKDMYTIRNSIMHGRIDEVLGKKVKGAHQLDVQRFQRIVHALGTLQVLNGVGLRDAATRLAVGETVQLKTLRIAPDYWSARRRARPPVFPQW